MHHVSDYHKLLGELNLIREKIIDSLRSISYHEMIIIIRNELMKELYQEIENEDEEEGKDHLLDFDEDCLPANINLVD